MMVSNPGYTDYFMQEHNGGFNYHLTGNIYDKSDNLIGHTLDDNQGMDFRLAYGNQCHIMQSSEDADKVIAMFDSAIQQGFHPEAVEQDIYEQLNVNPNDLTDFDKVRISHAVNKLWSEANY